MSESSPGLPKTIPYYLAERIQHGIVRGRYPPGSNLREMDLGSEYGISRGPVREGLRLLELQGLVVHLPRRGFRVANYSKAEIEHLYRLRAHLEGFVIDALAGKNTGDLADTLNEINRRMRKCTSREDIERYFELNITFHQMIIDSAESTTLTRVLSIVNDMSLPLRYMLLSQNFPETNDFEYHQNLLEAIRGCDFALARRLTENHVLENLPKVLRSYCPAGDGGRERG